MAESLRILVVDDEEAIRFFLAETLQREGHVVTLAASGEEALGFLQKTPFDIALLDLVLGGRIDGQRILEAIRWRWPGMAVIMLTAHGTLESALSAIQEGVDGYLLKPVRPSEVREAVQMALERRKQCLPVGAGAENISLLRRGPFTLDLQKSQVTRDEEALPLSASEFKLMSYLMQNANRPVPPDELVKVVRDFRPEYMHEARQVIKWYIYRLRHKVEPEPSNPRYIVTVRGVGHMFQDNGDQSQDGEE